MRLRVTQGLPQLLEHVDSAGLPRSLDDGVVEVEVDEGRHSELLAALAAAGVRYREIALRKPTLEDYFLKLAVGTRPADAALAGEDRR